MMVDYNSILESYRDKKVFITGHTGFKGSWMTAVLLNAGAHVTGYSLNPPTDPSLFNLSGLCNGDQSVNTSGQFTSIIADIRDREKLEQSLIVSNPDFLFHLAAQPIVLESYKDPVGTYETNVMGTVNLLEAVRKYSNNHKDKIISVLNVTTDKVYKNNEWYWGYREDEPLDGYDPYSNSKSCSELVTHSYKSSFFDDDNTVRVSTARAGNVIGGGDFASNRIIPDCVRAVQRAHDNSLDAGEVILRNPNSVRPYQHVLDPIFAYLMVAARQYEDKSYSGYYNVGPDEGSCVTTGELEKTFSATWDESRGDLPILNVTEQGDLNAPHESRFLKLDTSKLKETFGWKPVWDINDALKKTAEFTKVMITGGDIRAEMDREIETFVNEG